jgi:hypothetical protein
LTLGKRSDRSPSRYRRNESIGLLFDHCELTRAFSVLIDQNPSPRFNVLTRFLRANRYRPMPA